MTGDVATSCERKYEYAKHKHGAEEIQDIVSGFFACVAGSVRDGWDCYVNDEMCQVPEPNVPMHILLEKLHLYLGKACLYSQTLKSTQIL